MTRLIWVIIFAVIVGLLTVFTLRSLQRSTGAALGAEDLVRARSELVHRFPRAYFTIRLVSPNQQVRNVSLTVRPGPYSNELDAMLDRVESILREELEPRTYDTLQVFVTDSLARTVPLR